MKVLDQGSLGLALDEMLMGTEISRHRDGVALSPCEGSDDYEFRVYFYRHKRVKVPASALAGRDPAMVVDALGKALDEARNEMAADVRAAAEKMDAK